VKSFIKFFAIVLSACVFLQSSPAYSVNAQAVNNSGANQLEYCLKKIQELPEARQLMSRIQKEGAIRFSLSNNSLSQQFGAFWDADNRIIFVNPNWHQERGELIGSIIFEMHNASVSSQLDRLDYLAANGQIDKDKYVESVERIEYVNSKNAAALIEKGIKSGLFPESARLMTYSTFDEHFYYQKKGGHSAWIAKTYDHLSQAGRMKG